MKKFIQFIFFGNYFYGLCAAALAVEASLQQRIGLPHWSFFLFVFCATIWFYTESYRTEKPPATTNSRVLWYFHNRKSIAVSQFICIASVLLLFILFIAKDFQDVIGMKGLEYALFLVFPVVAFLYHGIRNRAVQFNLRQIGWLKPFVIGFSWAGLVTVYPLLYHQVVTHTNSFDLIYLFLFIKNFMFVAVLSIMFDIKDYATDANLELKTFVVKNGLRHTIFIVLIPLIFIGWGSFILYGLLHHFSLMKILLNTIPFAATLLLAYRLQRRQSIFFYLVLIDGIMLLKAACGIVAVSFF